jgi:hypothetical protein
LRPQVSGAGNLERFDYWLNTLQASAMMMRIACERGTFETAIKALGDETDPAARQPLAEAALAGRLRLNRLHEDFEYHIGAARAEGAGIVWPATAPGINQTVIVTP